MLAHPDDFMPFLPSVTGEDSAGALDDGEITTKEFKKYCRLVAETGEWGGEPEVSRYGSGDHMDVDKLTLPLPPAFLITRHDF